MILEACAITVSLSIPRKFNYFRQPGCKNPESIFPMQNAKILWADDEIDLLKAHILFLEQKGHKVSSVSNGADAIEAVRNETFDIVFLDENMPGMNGLEALAGIKAINPNIPIIMITKSEEEEIMNDAIGSKITDYLIKPVNPSQILSAIKKVLQNKELVTAKVNTGYQQDFRKIGMQFYDDLNHNEWMDIYKKLNFWEREMESNNDTSMREVLMNQQVEANVNFSKFVMRNYIDWLHIKTPVNRPILSPEVLSESMFKDLDSGYESVFFILIDCMRYDQWKEFEPLMAEYFHIAAERTYVGILPTATQYARNAIFAGLYPSEIAAKYPKYWKNDEEEGGKNMFEAELLRENISRAKINAKWSYHKVITNDQGTALVTNYKNMLQNKMNVLVYNFIDALSHSRTEVDIIRELAPTPAAYRSLSRSWLEHSPLLELMRKLAEHNVKIILTTDHGTMKVNRPVKIIGDRNTTTNLRYKQGRNLSYDNEKYLFTIRKPEDGMLPKTNMTSTYVFTSEDYFFAYPNNYNHYVNHFKDTFQHGGISLDEMVIPIVDLLPKR
jgi:DNA-binding response OmpR family regulator